MILEAETVAEVEFMANSQTDQTDSLMVLKQRLESDLEPERSKPAPQKHLNTRRAPVCEDQSHRISGCSTAY